MLGFGTCWPGAAPSLPQPTPTPSRRPPQTPGGPGHPGGPCRAACAPRRLPDGTPIPAVPEPRRAPRTRPDTGARLPPAPPCSPTSPGPAPAPASSAEPGEAGPAPMAAGGGGGFAAGHPHPRRRASPPGPPAPLSRSPAAASLRAGHDRELPCGARPGLHLRTAPPIPGPGRGGGGLRSGPGRGGGGTPPALPLPQPGCSCGQHKAGAAPPPLRCLPAACTSNISGHLGPAAFVPLAGPSFPPWDVGERDGSGDTAPPPFFSPPRHGHVQGRLQVEAGPETEHRPVAPHAMGQGWGAGGARWRGLHGCVIPPCRPHPATHFPAIVLHPLLLLLPKLDAGGGGWLCAGASTAPSLPLRPGTSGRKQSPLCPPLAWVPLPWPGCSHLWGAGAVPNVGLGASLPCRVPQVH